MAKYKIKNPENVRVMVNAYREAEYLIENVLATLSDDCRIVRYNAENVKSRLDTGHKCLNQMAQDLGVCDIDAEIPGMIKPLGIGGK